MTTDPDVLLLKRFSRGEDAALGELALRHERGLLGLAMGMLGDSDLARDAVQEMWVRVIRSAAHFQGQSSVKTWLYRIVINRCLDMRAARRRDMSQAGMAEGERFTPLDINTLERAEADEGRARVRSAVQRLSDGQQIVLMLSYHDGMTHEIGAEVLGIPVGTFKSRLHGALVALRERLGAEVLP